MAFLSNLRLLDSMSPDAIANRKAVVSGDGVGGYSLVGNQEDTEELETQRGGWAPDVLSDEEESDGKFCPLSFGDGNTERGGFVMICGRWR